MYFTDNPIRDAERYFSEIEEYDLYALKCEECGEPLHEKYIETDGGNVVCEYCSDWNNNQFIEENYDDEASKESIMREYESWKKEHTVYIKEDYYENN